MKDLTAIDPESMTEVLTANEVAATLKCSVKTIYKLRKSMQLPARYKIFDGEKGFRWLRSDVECYLQGKQLQISQKNTSKGESAPDLFVPVASPYP